MVMFLGKELGNVMVGYRIETVLDAPALTLRAARSGTCLVLAGDPVAKVMLDDEDAVETIDEAGADALIGGTSATAVVKGSKAVPDCVCIGYMLVKLTYGTDAIEKVEPTGASSSTTNWAKTKTKKYVEDYILTTAYNVTRKSGSDKYAVHTANEKNPQTHVEQICAYRLRAFIDHLRTLRDTSGPMFNLKNMTASGIVRFSGKTSSKKALSRACEACEGVWATLKGDHKFLAPIDLAQE